MNIRGHGAREYQVNISCSNEEEAGGDKSEERRMRGGGGEGSIDDNG